MDHWVENGWIGKGGDPVKNRDLWEHIYEEKQERRMMMALPLEDSERSKLQTISKTLILQYSRR
jgi:ribonuclease HI